MQSLSMRADDWVPPVIKTVATTGTGVAELASAIDDYEAFLATGELGHQRRIANWRIRLREMLRDEVLRRIVRRSFLRRRRGPIRRPGRRPRARPLFPDRRDRRQPRPLGAIDPDR